MAAIVGRSGQGNFRTGRSGGRSCGAGAVCVIGHGDGILGGCGRCILLEDGLDLHIAVRHDELAVGDAHAAADDLPLLEVVAGVGRSGQGDLRTGRSREGTCGSCAVAVRFYGDRMLCLLPRYQRELLFGAVAHAVLCAKGEDSAVHFLLQRT